jgi:hypothetical protein
MCVCVCIGMASDLVKMKVVENLNKELGEGTYTMVCAMCVYCVVVCLMWLCVCVGQLVHLGHAHSLRTRRLLAVHPLPGMYICIYVYMFAHTWPC